MRIGELEAVPALARPDLLAAPVARALRRWVTGQSTDRIWVAEIDPVAADTALFCASYGVGKHESANCVVVVGRRGTQNQFAACLVLANARVDVNNVVRRRLEARKASFAPTEEAVSQTAMEPGGITPVGLPSGWPLFIASEVAIADRVVIGSGLRRSKLIVPGALLAELPGAQVLPDLAIAAGPSC
ncbi:MAG: YbaK/EbsC family protein [Mycobacteriales bacterium]